MQEYLKKDKYQPIIKHAYSLTIHLWIEEGNYLLQGIYFHPWLLRSLIKETVSIKQINEKKQVKKKMNSI